MTEANMCGQLLTRAIDLAGPDAAVITHTTSEGTTIDIIGVDPDRYPAYNEDDPLSAARITTARSGMRMVSTRAITLRRALDLAVSILAFPPRINYPELRLVNPRLTECE